MQRKLVITDSKGIAGEHIFNTETCTDSEALHFLLCETLPEDDYTVKFQNWIEEEN